jgi:hypothetical protein
MTRLSLALPVLVVAFVFPCLAQTIPPVQAKALDDSEVALPKPGGQQALILVLGFSHKSGAACAAWGKRLAADYASDPHASYYQLAELQSAPSFVRGMILRGMRKDVPPSRHSHFLPLFDHEGEWKTLVQFSAPDDPYVLVTAPDGRVLWQTHGALSDSAYPALQAAVAQFSARPAKP